MYRIQYSAKVLKELNNLENRDYLRIRERIISLVEEPRPTGSLKLTNEDGYRTRVGDYRILYEIDDDNKIIKLLKLGHRKEIYKKK
jgi:mRNA interferase RelE/StbE